MSAEVIDIICEQFAACPSAMSKLIVERPHGAALCRAPTATAFPHRSPGYSILILGQWEAPEKTNENAAWVRETFDRLEPYSKTGAYSNYLNDDEYETRIGEALGSNLQRLKTLKDQYDPKNIFHMNQNILPSGS